MSLKMKNSISSPQKDKEKDLDISQYPLKKLEELYWITKILTPFNNWIAIFWKEDGTRWWIRKDWFIIWEGYQFCWQFINWVAIWTKAKDGKHRTQWFIKEDGSILAAGFDSVGGFFGWISSFQKSDLKWWIDTSWKIIAKNFSAIKKHEEWNTKYKFTLYPSNLWCILDLSEFKNWFCPFYIEDIKRYWLISDNWVILADNLDKTYPFDEFLEWFAKFENKWKEWYINTFWNILDFKKLYKLNWKFEGFYKFEKNTGEIWYLDSKFREWDWIDNKKWILFLKKWDKWFKRSMVK